MAEKEKIKSTERIVLDAPEILEVGQNFLDQAPFKSLLEQISSTNTVEFSAVSQTLVFLVNRPWILNHLDDYWIKHGELPERVKKLINRQDRIKFRSDLVSAMRSLDEFPYWKEYIEAQYDKGLYTGTEWNPKGSAAIHPEKRLPFSYANWVTKRLRAEKNAVLLGIEEIFPQDLGEDIPQLRPEKGPGYRRWVILKASEIAPSQN